MERESAVLVGNLLPMRERQLLGFRRGAKREIELLACVMMIGGEQEPAHSCRATLRCSGQQRGRADAALELLRMAAVDVERQTSATLLRSEEVEQKLQTP